MTTAMYFALLFAALYFGHREHGKQMDELKKSMDFQLAGIRFEIKQAQDALKWIEPHLLHNDFGGYMAAEHTGLKSVREVIAALDEGKYKEALVPWCAFRSPKARK